MDANGLADPYIRVELLPSVQGINRQKTDILKGTREPDFEGESFTLLVLGMHFLPITKSLSLRMYSMYKMSHKNTRYYCTIL